MTNNQGPKIALLDTGNSSIQLPEFVWRNILKELIKQNNDDLIFSSDTNLEDNTKTIKANKHCDDVIPFLKPISFKLQATLITIQPKGYTYMMAQN